MAKGKGRRIRASNRAAGQNMRQQIQKLQEQMLQTQEALGDQTVSRHRRRWRGRGGHDRAPAGAIDHASTPKWWTPRTWRCSRT